MRGLLESDLTVCGRERAVQANKHGNQVPSGKHTCQFAATIRITAFDILSRNETERPTVDTGTKSVRVTHEVAVGA